MRIVYVLIAFILLFLLFGWTGTQDEADRINTIRERRNYCKMVKSGVWPDHKGTYKRDCGGEDPPAREDDQFYSLVF